MRDRWRYASGVLLVVALPLAASFSQAEDQPAKNQGDAELACNAYTLEGLAPGLLYTEVEELVRAREPRPRSAGKIRAYDADLGWNAVHSWDVPAGTLEVWYNGRIANKKENPAVVRVRLLPQDVTVEALWKSVFDRFGPMSNWKREDCNLIAVVGLDKDQPHVSISLLSWEGDPAEAENQQAEMP